MAKIDERFNLSISLSLQSVETGYQVRVHVSSDTELFSKAVLFRDLDRARANYEQLIENMEDIEEVIYYG